MFTFTVTQRFVVCDLCEIEHANYPLGGNRGGDHAQMLERARDIAGNDDRTFYIGEFQLCERCARLPPISRDVLCGKCVVRMGVPSIQRVEQRLARTA